MIYVIKFYESQKDYDEKNPFHKHEMVGTLEEVEAEAEKIKAELNACCYKIKEKKI